MKIILDTETTGLINKQVAALEAQPQIIEVGIIKTNDKFKIEGKYSWLVNPLKPLPDEITKITKLTDDDLKDKLPFPAIYTELCEVFLGVDTLIAHNLPFDKGLLRFELMRIGKEFSFPWPPNQVCTVEATMHFKGFRLKMSKLWEYLFDEERPIVHRALEDCEQLLVICKELQKRGTIS